MLAPSLKLTILEYDSLDFCLFAFSLGHMRPSSPLLDSVRDQFEDYEQLAKDFTRVFLNVEPSCLTNAHLFDVTFLVGQSKQKSRFIGVRAILGVRSRVFQVNFYLPS